METKNVIKKQQERIGAAFIREFLGLRSQDVAKQVGRSSSVFNRIENGVIGLSLEMGLVLAEMYCCTPEEIKLRPSEGRLKKIKDAFDLRNARAVIARQEKGVA